jgi:hypothetical protein
VDGIIFDPRLKRRYNQYGGFVKKLTLAAAVIGVAGFSMGAVFWFWILPENLYFPELDYIRCTAPHSCFHEAGHQLDHHLGWPSKTPEFERAIFSYAAACPDYTPGEVVYVQPHERLYPQFCESIRNYPGIFGNPGNPAENLSDWVYFALFYNGAKGGYMELYATIHEIAEGRIELIPEQLRAFYLP